MDEKLPLSAKIYIAIITATAVAFISHLAISFTWNNIKWLDMAVFLLLIFSFDAFPVKMPKGGVVAVSFAPMLASVFLFHPIIVVIIVLLSDFLSWLRQKNKRPVQYLFNASQLALTLGCTALVYNYYYQGSLPKLDLQFIGAAVAAVFVFLVLNSLLVTLVISLVDQVRFWPLWLSNLKWSIPNYIGTAPLGILIAFIYLNLGLWGLILFLFPLILARYSFQAYIDIRQSFLDAIETLSLAIEAKDLYTRGHSTRVADYVGTLAKELKWSDDRVERLQYVAVVHDLGKVAVPESILKKPDRLNEEEFQEMKTHAEIGATIMANTKYFDEGADIIRHHHERWDGTGYPARLRGEEIPMGARILAVADSFDAMTSDRPYRKALGFDVALQEILKGAGTQYDPAVVEAFVRIYPQLVGQAVPAPAEAAKKEAAPAKTTTTLHSAKA